MGERTPLAASTRRHPAGWRWRGHHQPAGRADRARRASSSAATGWPPAARPAARDAALYEPCKAVGMELCPALGICVPVGKDSLSMRTRWQGEGGAAKKVTSPVTLIVTAFATLADVRGDADAAAAAPATRRWCSSTSARAATAWAARSWRRCSEQFGDAVPDLDDPALLNRWSTRSTRCAPQGSMLAYHDRSDGGLWAAACEMAFAGHVGCQPQRRSAGDRRRRHQRQPRRVWRCQELGVAGRARRRDELTLKALFNEELGVVLQVPTAARDEVMQVLRAHGLAKTAISSARPPDRGVESARSGATPRRCSARRCATCTRSGTRSAGGSASSATTRPAPTRSTRPPAATTTRACTSHLAVRPGRGRRGARPESGPRRRSRSCASRASTPTSRWATPSPRPASKPTTCT